MECRWSVHPIYWTISKITWSARTHINLFSRHHNLQGFLEFKENLCSTGNDREEPVGGSGRILGCNRSPCVRKTMWFYILCARFGTPRRVLASMHFISKFSWVSPHYSPRTSLALPRVLNEKCSTAHTSVRKILDPPLRTTPILCYSIPVQRICDITEPYVEMGVRIDNYL